MEDTGNGDGRYGTMSAYVDDTTNGGGGSGTNTRNGSGSSDGKMHRYTSQNSRTSNNTQRHTAQQIQVLESFFNGGTHHPDEKARMQLSRELGMTPLQVKFWFQNRRTQFKAKQGKAEMVSLRAENETIRGELDSLKEALENVVCKSCGGPCQVDQDNCIKQQKLQEENARLKQEIQRLSREVEKYTLMPVSQLNRSNPVMQGSPGMPVSQLNHNPGMHVSQLNQVNPGMHDNNPGMQGSPGMKPVSQLNHNLGIPVSQLNQGNTGMPLSQLSRGNPGMQGNNPVMQGNNPGMQSNPEMPVSQLNHNPGMPVSQLNHGSTRMPVSQLNQGRRNLMKLSQHMVKSFCASINPTDGIISEMNDFRVQTTVKNCTNPGHPNIRVFSASTTIWLPFSPQKIFDFLRNENTRLQWDVVSDYTAVQEVGRIACESYYPWNYISILKATTGQNNNEFILQESCFESSTALLVYCHVNLPAINRVISGEDPSLFSLFPSGFAISAGGNTSGEMSGGSLVTILLHAFETNATSDNISREESADKINNFVAMTINNIKAALN